MLSRSVRRLLWSRWAKDFDFLKLHPELKYGLNESKHVKPTFCQAEAYTPISKGQDCIIYSETGSGKTLAYILPTLNRLYSLYEIAKENKEINPLSFERPVIILCPTVDLCAQVAAIIKNIDQLSRVSVQGLGKIWGTWPIKEARPDLVHPRIKWGSMDIIVSTPVKFVEDMRRFNPDGFVPSAIIMDEVDLLLQGSTKTYIFDIIQQYRPRLNVRQPGEIRSRLPKMLPVQFIFAAATMVHIGPFSAGNMIIERFGSATTVTSPGFHQVPSNINQTWIDASDDWDERVFQLISLLNERPGRTLVFVNSSHNCRILTDFLKEKEWPVVSYSKGPMGRMGPRMGDVAQFVDGKAQINILTDFGGRGTDWPDVDHVINFQMPRDAMCWIHRIGRTGRMGKKGFVTNFVAPRDENLVNLIRPGGELCMDIEPAFSRKRSQRKKRRDYEAQTKEDTRTDPYLNAGKLKWVPGEPIKNNKTLGGGEESDSDDEDDNVRVGQTREKLTRRNNVEKATGFDALRQKIIDNENEDDDEFTWEALGLQGKKTGDVSEHRKIFNDKKSKKSISAQSKFRVQRNYTDMDDDVRL